MEFNSNEAFACIREIVEDLDEPIGIEMIDELIDFCNEDYEDYISFLILHKKIHLIINKYKTNNNNIKINNQIYDKTSNMNTIDR